MERLPEEGVRRGHLDDLPEIHDRDSITDVSHHGQVVGDEQIGEPESGLELVEQVEDLGLDRYVESGDGLVGDDEAGVQCQGAGNADALPLTSGEFVREPIGVFRIEPDQLEQRSHPVATASLRPSRYAPRVALR